MLGSIHKKIGDQLFLLLSLLVILLFFPFAYSTWSLFIEYGEFAAEVNEKSIKKQVYAYIDASARENALTYDNYFEKIRVTASLMAIEAARIYDNITGCAKRSAVPPLQLNPENNFYQTPFSVEISTVYWGQPVLTPYIQTELAALTELDPLLKRVKQELPETLATHMISTSGIGRYYTLNKSAKETVLHLPPRDVFDLRDGAPVTIFTSGEADLQTAHWTPPYKDDIVEGLMITASGPIVTSHNEFMGIAGIDLPLENVNNALLKIDTKLHDQSGQTVFTFLLDEKGRIISFPQPYQEVFGLDMDISHFKDSADIVHFSFKTSTNPKVRELTDEILGGGDSIHTLTLNDDIYIVSTHKMATIGWYFGLVTSEKGMLQSVAATNSALQQTLAALKKKYLLIGLFGLLLLGLFILYVRKRYITPIEKLSRNAASIAKGDFAIEINWNRSDELGELGSSLDNMVRALSRADALHKTYEATLEKQIYERTMALSAKNHEQVALIERLNAESERLKDMSLALAENRDQMRAVTEHSLVGLCILRDERPLYCNAGLSRLTGYSIEEMRAFASFRQVVHPENMAIIEQEIQKRMAGEAGSPYQIQLVRKDGSTRHVLVEGKRIPWEGSLALIVTLVDVTQLKEVEQQLREKELVLQKSLSEKEILLQEVYHRTKNNMLVIISLLDLQMGDIQDEQARKIFKETENRIRSMSLIHENLYANKNIANIDLQQYVRGVAENLIDSMTVDSGIKLKIDCEPMELSLEKAMPLGLIINEIITNSVQHAFPESKKGIVYITLKGSEGIVELRIGDNGIGMQSRTQLSHSFGTQLITNLIEMQLQGSVEVLNGNGTHYHIQFAV